MKLTKYIIVFLVSINCSYGAFIAVGGHSDTNPPQKSPSNELRHAVKESDDHWIYMTEGEYKEKENIKDVCCYKRLGRMLCVLGFWILLISIIICSKDREILLVGILVSISFLILGLGLEFLL